MKRPEVQIIPPLTENQIIEQYNIENNDRGRFIFKTTMTIKEIKEKYPEIYIKYANVFIPSQPTNE